MLLVCHALSGALNLLSFLNAFDISVTIDVSHSVMMPWSMFFFFHFFNTEENEFCVPGGASAFGGASVDVVLDVVEDVVLDSVLDVLDVVEDNVDHTIVLDVVLDDVLDNVWPNDVLD